MPLTIPAKTFDKPCSDKYPAYKYSGEYWLGEVPIHWEIKKLKHIFHEKKKKFNPDLSCGSISFGEVIFKDEEKIPESTKASYQEVLEGEFLINPLNLNYDLISLRIGLSEINVVVSPGYIVLKNLTDVNRKYYKYLLHRYDIAYMKLLGAGVRQTINFNQEDKIIDELLESVDLSTYGLERTKLNYAIGLDDSATELDPQNPNPRGAHGGDEEKDPLDEIIRSFNERWFHGWDTTPEDQRIKFISLSKHIQAHPDYQSKVANNKDAQNRDLAFKKILDDVMRKQRKKELELYKLYAKDESFYQALFDTMKRIIDYPGIGQGK